MTPSFKSLPFGVSRPLLHIAAATLLVTILSLAKAVLMPLAMAALIGFVLIAPVTFLERAGLHRMLSVVLVLLVVLSGVAGFGYALYQQFTDLAAHMPQYSVSIKSKLAALRATRNGSLTQIQDTVEKADHDVDKQEKATRPPAVESPMTVRKDVQPVLVVPKQPDPAERLRTMWQAVARPMLTAGIVLVLAIFILVQREDIRNRLLRLAGRRRLAVTTRTLDEAAQRIRRFLFSQSLINTVFGLVIAVGLLLIGIRYAVLWGATAALLRFVPYLGTTLAMLLPAGLAFVESDGWGPTLETLVLFWAAGLAGYLLDPIVNGTRTGSSSFALLLSTIFWTWLWGPVGLLLSTPIAVCLLSIGKHVPEMKFLDVLLSDEPPLDASVSFYQRLLAGDEVEARAILDRELGKAARELVFDRIVVPTLLLAERDRCGQKITPAERQRVVQATLTIVQNSGPSSRQDESRCVRKLLLGVPARTAGDQVALEMLSQLLGATWTLVQLPATVRRASKLCTAIEKIKPDMLCIAALAPAGGGYARHLCRQLHSCFPDLPIWVLRVGADSDVLKLSHQLRGDGAQRVASSFAAAATQFTQSPGAAMERPTAALRLHLGR